MSGIGTEGREEDFLETQGFGRPQYGAYVEGRADILQKNP